MAPISSYGATAVCSLLLATAAFQGCSTYTLNEGEAPPVRQIPEWSSAAIYARTTPRDAAPLVVDRANHVLVGFDSSWSYFSADGDWRIDGSPLDGSPALADSDGETLWLLYEGDGANGTHRRLFQRGVSPSEAFVEIELPAAAQGQRAQSMVALPTKGLALFDAENDYSEGSLYLLQRNEWRRPPLPFEPTNLLDTYVDDTSQLVLGHEYLPVVWDPQSGSTTALSAESSSKYRPYDFSLSQKVASDSDVPLYASMHAFDGRVQCRKSPSVVYANTECSSAPTIFDFVFRSSSVPGENELGYARLSNAGISRYRALGTRIFILGIGSGFVVQRPSPALP